ncbi:MAG: lytic murein transglycosylase B [Pseudomonadota bacterium]
MKPIYSIPVLLACLSVLPVRAATLPGIPEFIDEMVARHQFNREELEHVFDRAQYLPSVIETISRPATAKPWPEYRANFVNPERVKFGLKFWQKYLNTLRRAEREFGVPQEIIVALIGVETIYGQDAGTFRILDALTTLAFDFPRREEFFRSELENYLLLARDQQFNMLAIRGSYAGAIGIPQFMPSSYRNFAVDFNGNQKIDLLSEPGDAIGSVANYLREYGWTNSAPVAVRAQVVEKNWIGEITAPRTLEEWSAVGIAPSEKLPKDLRARLADFTVENGKELWLVFNDFDVITRYNNSDFYAMTVFQLAEELKAARKVSSAR